MNIWLLIVISFVLLIILSEILMKTKNKFTKNKISKTKIGLWDYVFYCENNRIQSSYVDKINIEIKYNWYWFIVQDERYTLLNNTKLKWSEIWISKQDLFDKM